MEEKFEVIIVMKQDSSVISLELCTMLCLCCAVVNAVAVLHIGLMFSGLAAEQTIFFSGTWRTMMWLCYSVGDTAVAIL